MCKAHKSINDNDIQFLIRDYEVLAKNNLGLPNCLCCGEEPEEIFTEETGCEHRMHIDFRPCGHVVGYSSVT